MYNNTLYIFFCSTAIFAINIYTLNRIKNIEKKLQRTYKFNHMYLETYTYIMNNDIDLTKHLDTIAEIINFTYVTFKLQAHRLNFFITISSLNFALTLIITFLLLHSKLPILIQIFILNIHIMEIAYTIIIIMITKKFAKNTDIKSIRS